MIAHPLCKQAYDDYHMSNDIPLTGVVSWANIPNLADSIIETQNAQVDLDFMLRYLTGRFFKGEVDVKLDEADQARKEKWRQNADGKKEMEAFLEQCLEVGAKSRAPSRPITDSAEQRSRWAAEGWTVTG